jgi:hypothetical protein
VSFRAPPALVEAAKLEADLTSTSELGILVLAMLARPDSVAAFFRRTGGALTPDHEDDGRFYGSNPQAASDRSCEGRVSKTGLSGCSR